MMQAQLLTQAVLALAERRDASADRGDMLADAEVDPLYEGRVDLPAQQGQNLIDRLQGAKYHAVLHVAQAPPPNSLDHLRGEPRGQRHPARLGLGAFGLATWRLPPGPRVGQPGRQRLP